MSSHFKLSGNTTNLSSHITLSWNTTNLSSHLKLSWNIAKLTLNNNQPVNAKSIFDVNISLFRNNFQWYIKREVHQDPELESLSDWVRTIRSLVQGRIHKLENCVNSRPKSVLKDQEAVKCLSSLHDKYVVVPADKASSQTYLKYH